MTLAHFQEWAHQHVPESIDAQREEARRCRVRGDAHPVRSRAIAHEMRSPHIAAWPGGLVGGWIVISSASLTGRGNALLSPADRNIFCAMG